MPMLGAQHSAVLGVPPGADADRLKVAYRTQSLRYHPDQPGGSADMFQRVAMAYDALSKQLHDERWATSSSAYGAHASVTPVKALTWNGPSQEGKYTQGDGLMAAKARRQAAKQVST